MDHRTRARALFAPRDEIWRHIVEALDATETRAELAVFTITDNRITRAILEAQERGVQLRIVSDNDKANDRGSDVERLARGGIPVRLDRTDVHMHHKFAVFDERLLVTGSYNWTRSAANENAENVVFTDDPKLVEAFLGEFRRCWGQGEPY